MCFGGGPFASINFGAYDADLFDDFGDDLDQLRAHFCLFWDWAHLEDDIAIVDGDTVGCHALCQTFVEDYGAPRGDIKLPGPVYTASNNCIGQPDPESEWIDGPIGVRYTNRIAHRWTTNDGPSITLVLREGDDQNCDDIIGAIKVSRSDQGPIIFYAWHFGWLILENDTVSADGT
ncbi:MAG: hypothetical protein IPG92_15340, partial [Flavobacteriales bacterium]|nr:hypothetical protein [Flavobacteriales bacterium]